MSIITFWSNDDIETGQTMSMVAVATYLAIEHNAKILMINTAQNDFTMEDSFWSQIKVKRKIMKNKEEIVTGLTGLTRAILSNKKFPEIITHYTRIIFRNRLELLTDNEILNEDFIKQKKTMKEIVSLANQYYDLVFIDLKGTIEDKYIKDLLSISNIVIYNLTQRMRNINNYINLKEKELLLQKDNVMLLIGKYNPRLAKYTARNIARYMKEKEIYSIPFANLFFEVSNEGMLADYFIKFRKIRSSNPNALFMLSVKKISDDILKRIKELQMKIY